MEEFVRGGMFVWRRSAAGLEDFDHKDVVDLVGFLVEKHHEIVGIRGRDTERPRLRNVRNAERHDNSFRL